MTRTLPRRLVAELLGTALLMVAIVGSGITMGDGASGLFHHAVVVGAVLVALIVALGPVSGAHFNPAVSLAFAMDRDLPRREVLPYIAVQVAGAAAGAIVANLLFSEPAIAAATGDRGGLARIASEAVATGGLVLVILGPVRSRQHAHVPYVVGAYIAAAIVFTSSASFANPAVTVGRALTGTWTGIRLEHVPGFLAGQLVGAVLAVLLARWLFTPAPRAADDTPDTAAGAPTTEPEEVLSR